MDKPLIWAIQHVAFETLDGFQPVLEHAGYEVRYVTAYEDLSIIKDGAALVVLGGPISANDEARYPFLTGEMHLIERWMRDERPVLGICLGAQLIARTIGGRVYSGKPEIGIAPVSLLLRETTDLLAAYATEPLTFHWHGDHIELPDGITATAETADCPTQAFEIGKRTVGFQFHPETSMNNIDAWLLGHAAELSYHTVDVNQLRSLAIQSASAFSVKTQMLAHSWASKVFPEHHN